MRNTKTNVSSEGSSSEKNVKKKGKIKKKGKRFSLTKGLRVDTYTLIRARLFRISPTIPSFLYYLKCVVSLLGHKLSILDRC